MNYSPYRLPRDPRTVGRNPLLRPAMLAVLVLASVGSNARSQSLVQPELVIDFPNCFFGGLVTAKWSGATPGGTIALLYARSTGNEMIPNGRPCAGTQLGLSGDSLQLVHATRSDASGCGAARAIVSHAACGGRVQLLDVSTCSTSEAVLIWE